MLESIEIELEKIFEEPDGVVLFILLPLSITLLVIDEEPDTKFVLILLFHLHSQQ
jgi:hypothetical protein